MSREEAIARFLAAHGFGAARVAALAGDASFRRYHRLSGGPRPAVVMDAPPGREDAAVFLHVAALLRGAGLSVPDVIAAAPELGLVLAEDFGDALYASVLTEANQAMLFDAAIDALARLHGAVISDSSPAWDAQAMARATEATFLDWWWPASFGVPASGVVRADFAAAMAAMLAPLAEGPRVLVHRDYFAGNLFWLPERAGYQRVGVIDFQDAAVGHPAYDVASLVEDARRDVPAGAAERALARYLAQTGYAEAPFRAAFAICGAQRHLRVASLWVRLACRDGKPAYLAYGPRTWSLLERALRHPACAPLAAFMDRYVPPARRGNPEVFAA